MKHIFAQRFRPVYTLLVLFVVFFIFVFVPAEAVAQTVDTFGLAPIEDSTALSTRDIRLIVAEIIRAVLGLLGIIALVLILAAGFIYMTAAGNEERITQAKQILRNAVIGLVIILSAFAITQFIITRLSEAIAGGEGGAATVGCSNIVYANEHPTECGVSDFSCSQSRTCCSIDHFVVKSITPSTPVDSTRMNNVVARVIFSHAVADDIPPGQIFEIHRDGIDVSGEFDFRFSALDRMVAEAVPVSGNTIPSGNYEVIVRANVRDAAGNPLEESTDCGEFGQLATFVVADTDTVLDLVPPTVSGLTIDGRQEIDQALTRGVDHQLALVITDNSGVGYVRIQVGETGSNDAPLIVYDGPLIDRGSSAPDTNPYLFSYPLLVAANAPVFTRYEVTATIVDIDSNVETRTASFIVVASHCDNNVQDGDETDIDFGGSCRGNDACTADWECASGVCDEVQGVCLATPLITDVSPWDGASGNWITVFGRYFGESEGVVSFGLDNSWVDARTVAGICGDADVWHDSYIVVEVPEMPAGSYAIRVSREDVSEVFDTTVNDIGPVGGPNDDGLFVKNETPRPGLCTATPAAGIPRTSVILSGNAFGTSPAGNQVLFGRNPEDETSGVPASITSWAAREIETSVPVNMQPGQVGVSVRVSGEESNSIPFGVLLPGEDRRPVIDTIDPDTTSPGSYVTIYGSNFGDTTGIVYLAPSSETVCTRENSTGPDPVCVQALLISNAVCGDTWEDSQIIVRIPETFPTTLRPPQAYAVFVEESLEHRQSDGATTIRVERGPANPGICRVEPDHGPSPRPTALPPLSIVGTNFTNNPTLYFWTVGSEEDDFSTWLSADGPPTIVGQSRTSDGLDVVETYLPIGAVEGAPSEGYSMQTGSIVLVAPGNRRSNSVRYTVDDCSAAPRDSNPGFQCCVVTDESGEVRGEWRDDSFVCPGEIRDAGYAWRFTTGRIPSIPSVIEDCRAFPSPAPWEEWPSGRFVCVNASIATRFTHPMDSESFSGRIRVYTCGTGDEPECSSGESQDITESDPLIEPRYENGVLTIREVRLDDPVDARLLPDTWYRVMLLDGIQSEEIIPVLSVDQVVHTPLGRTRPCGRTRDGEETVYCFDFKTAENAAMCTVTAAGIQPPEHTTNILGTLLTPGTRDPLYYRVWGRGSQECVPLNVDGYGWGWSLANTSTPPQAAITVAPDPPRYSDSRATGEALRETPRYTPAVVRAQAAEIVGTSNLRIDLGNPRVIEAWPNCAAACSNATIGARFNREMIVADFTPVNVRLFECPTERCFLGDPDRAGVEHFVPAPATANRIPLELPPDEQTPTVLSADILIALQPNTWYQAEISGEVASVAGYDTRTDPPTAYRGNTLGEPYIWKFKTKTDGSLCAADNVYVEPDPFTALFVGEKTRYRAIPFGSPDACSQLGQPLNPWGFGWRWNTPEELDTEANNEVAVVSDFLSIGRTKSYCTTQCLPRGSDILATEDRSSLYLCGNGTRDPGEDCDIAMTIPGTTDSEVVGVSCTLHCLRPGNLVSGTETNQCGNGIIELAFGEECDSPDRSICTDTCTNPGSRPSYEFDSTNPTAPYCGLGAVTDGEDCEGGLGGELTGITCSENCIHRGTPVAQYWCDGHSEDIVGGVAVEDAVECRMATSVCGNNILEADEECEVIGGAVNVHDLTSLLPLPVDAAILPTTQCTDACLLESNICSVSPYLPAYLSCNPGDPGCTADCTLGGSSLSYPDSSLCGDGIVGPGESRWCEFTGDEVAARTSGASVGTPPERISNAEQVVTAAGLGRVDNGEQSTTINATAFAYRGVDGGNVVASDITDTEGVGDYTLQCGYTEFESIEQDRYNNCPNAEHGVGDNSCCYIRPTRVESYPSDGTGLSAGRSDDVCRNTAISITWDGDIDERTLTNNFLVARGSTNGTCLDGEQNVTAAVSAVVAMASPAPSPEGFFARLWYSVRDLFVRFFGGVVRASDFTDTSVTAWCSGTISVIPRIDKEQNAEGGTISTTVSLAIQQLFDVDTTYAIFLRGGTRGIKDVRGVGIWSGDAIRTPRGRDDSILFHVGNRICTIDEIIVEPTAHLFSRPNTGTDIDPDNAHDFTAIAENVDNQQIVPIDAVYDWEWSWAPVSNAIINIPDGDALNHTDIVTIRSRDVEGEVAATANATVVADARITADNHVGSVFSGSTNITALFCENPWPRMADDPGRIIYPYEDGNPPGRLVNDDGYDPIRRIFDGSPLLPISVGDFPVYFNMGFGYCADAGESGDTSDDLPYLRPVIVGGEVVSELPPTPECPSGFRFQNDRCERDADCPSDPPGYFLGGGLCVFPSSGVGYDPAYLGGVRYTTGFPNNQHASLYSPSMVRYFEDNGVPYVAVIGGYTQRPALQIFDVSDSSNPVLVSTYPTNPTTDLNLIDPVELILSDNASGIRTAFIISAGSNTIAPAFTIINLDDPANPSLVMRYTGLGDTAVLGYPLFESHATTPEEQASGFAPTTLYNPISLILSKDGTRAYVGVHRDGRPAGSVYSDDGIAVFDISDPVSGVRLLGLKTQQAIAGEYGLTGSVLSAPNRLVWTDDRLFITSRQDYITVLDTTDDRDLAYITRISYNATTRPYVNNILAMTLSSDGSRLYVLSNVGSTLAVLTTGGATPLQELASINDERFLRSRRLVIAGDHAVVLTDSDTTVGSEDAVLLLDMTNLDNPQYVGRILDGSGGVILTDFPTAVALNEAGTVAYVLVSTSNRMEVISLEAQPTVTPTCGTTETRVDDVCFVPVVCPGSLIYSPADDTCIPPGAGAGAISADALKKFLFFNDKNTDAIGIQIFDNTAPIGAEPARFSASEWLTRRLAVPTLPANFRPIAIDGYDAVTDGNNYYVNFLNLGGGNEVYNNILLLSINPDAQENTRTVFDRIVGSLTFNINMTNFGYCSLPNATDPSASTDSSDACTSDFDCSPVDEAERICANAKTKLQRDWQRLQDIHVAQERINAYFEQTQSYPLLSSGTFIPGYTNSRWPSWARLGGAPLDPINLWEDCGGNDLQTCWNPSTSQFVCPERAQVYEYSVRSGGADYDFYSDLEFLDEGADIVGDFVDVGRFVNGRSCVAGQASTPFGATCGDGVVNSGEACDPPGRHSDEQSSCPVGQVSDSVCASDCTSWSTPVCISAGVCGNGRVEAGEICDDGTFNGRYGRCASGCQGPFVEYCGNVSPTQPDGTLDTPEEVCEVADDRYDETGFYVRNSCRDGSLELTQSQDTTDTYYGSSFVDANTGWVAGIHYGIGDPPPFDGVVAKVTVSGGTTNIVNQLVDAASRIYDVYFANSTNGWAVGGNSDGRMGVWRTTNGGSSWSEASLSNTTRDLNAVYFLNTSRGWAVGDGGVVIRTTDGGVNWNRQSIDSTIDLKDVMFVDDQIGYTVGTNGAIFKSADGGASWSRLLSETTNALRGVSFVNPDVGWVVGWNNEIRKTTNGGQSWISVAPLTSGRTHWEAVTFVDEQTGFVAGESTYGFIHTINGGATWVHRGIGALPEERFFTLSVLRTPWAGTTRGWLTGVGDTGPRIARLETDGYCSLTQNIDCPIEGSTNSRGDRCVGVTDTTYHPYVRDSLADPKSCANDCRTAGGYCGDRITQSQYEECDGDDGCTEFCLLSTPGEVVTLETGLCGDGVVQRDTPPFEVCDNGNRNGVPCTPTYGNRCTYCSLGCNQILTVEPVAYCGNGNIDEVGTDPRGNPIYERCDVNTASGEVVGYAENDLDNQTTLSCPADYLGSYTCSADCRTPATNNCVLCGAERPLNAGGAEPFVAIINPMIGDQLFDSAGVYKPGADAWRRSTQIALLHSGGATFDRGAIGGLTYRTLEENFIVQQPIFTPPSFGLETSLQCADEYLLDVNPQQNAAGGDYFPYIVAGEVGAVEREFIVSPALPRTDLGQGERTRWEALRIVVRWSDAEAVDQNAIFSGMIYNEAFGTSFGSVVGHTRAMNDRDGAGNPVDMICDDVQETQSTGGFYYWWPTGCEAGGYYGSISMHPLSHLAHTFIHSMTVTAGAGPVQTVNRLNEDTTTANDSPINTNYAFFVDAIGEPISRYLNSTLTVEVYGYHEGQDPPGADQRRTLSEVYAPVATFSIRPTASTASGSFDEYWHVFNIVRTSEGDGTYHYEIERFGPTGPDGQQHGTIEPGFQNVIANVPAS